jgi:methyltransferase (TIGR00027 family)
MSDARPNVSDTARWVAAMRASESARPDAVFKDPFAARLAGEVGRQMLAGLPARWGDTSWPMIARTVAIDDLVLRTVAEGADRVLNLAAGFDTRPWRMKLPRELTWVEADLPALIQEKEKALAGDAPTCTVESVAVDLADAAARAAFFDRALAGARRALVLTEGLLVYLDPETVRSFGRDLRARGEVAWWVHDLASPAILDMMRRSFAGKLGDSATFRFGPAEGVTFFKELGWRASDVVSLTHTARRLGRLPWLIRLFSYLPDANPENPGKRRPWSAVVREVKA